MTRLPRAKGREIVRSLENAALLSIGRAAAMSFSNTRTAEPPLSLCIPANARSRLAACHTARPRLYHLIIRVHLRLRSGAQSPSAPHTLPALFVSSLPHDCLIILLRDPVGVTARYCFKSFSCNTYRFPRKCGKQKTYGLANEACLS